MRTILSNVLLLVTMMLETLSKGHVTLGEGLVFDSAVESGVTPRFVTRARTFKVISGENLLLPCEVSNLGSSVLVWRKGSNLISAGHHLITSDKRFFLQSFNLQLRNVRIADQGDYTCQIGDGSLGDLIHTVEILTLTAEAGIQFRILCFFLSNLKPSDNTEASRKEYCAKMKSYIRHHIFILRFLESLQDYFSAAMLVQYITISPIICAEMFMIFESSNIFDLIKHGILFSCAVTQFGFYCFTTEFISSEAAAVSNAVYDSDWYSDFDLASRKSMVLIIARAQRKVVFTAGGFIEFNNLALVAVLRACWSACSLMRAMKRGN